MALGFSLCTLQACSSDDDEDSSVNPLVGAWTRPYTFDNRSEIYEFKEDGTFRKFVLFEKTESGIYSINENLGTLILSYNSGSTHTYLLTVLTDSYFVIQSMKDASSYTYNRREIDPNGTYDSFTSTKVDGHEAVDLGLSVKWASCNVGASSWEKEGDYFAWGETSTKAEYNESNYKWGEPTYDRWGDVNGMNFIKYCTDSEYGTVDNKKTLEAYDDVATVKWGKKWRMPTEEEFEELQQKCTRINASRNGVGGVYYVASNGNYIFLPETGYKDGSSKSHGDYYWTSSMDENSGYYAWYYGYNCCGTCGRYQGLPVRPVCK